MRRIFYFLISFFIFFSATCPVSAANRHVILISIDGLRSDAITALSKEEAPNFHNLIETGASTLNARTDPDWTVTMPNHTCMLTGRSVMGENGHGYTLDLDDPRTIHEIKGSYVSSVFDVLYPALKRSAFLASKNKFVTFLRSYGCHGIAGYPDYAYQEVRLIDACKITDFDDAATVKAAQELLQDNPPYFLFIHLAGTDRVGHLHGWNISPGSAYLKEVQNQDRLIGKILEAVQKNPDLAHATAIILTTDHGGTGRNHQNIKDAQNFTIPFIVWGQDVPLGKDLYELNAGVRQNPGDQQISSIEKLQPIRNGDAANLALSLLGLPPIPGSTINAHQELNVFEK